MTKTMKKKVQSYNDRRSNGTVDGCTLPVVLSLEDVTNPAGPVFSSVRAEFDSVSIVF